MPVQIGGPTLSSGGEFSSVSERLSRWASNTLQERQAEALQEGRKVEIKDGEMPEQAKPLFGVLGAKSAENYNKGIRDAYLLSVDRDNTEEVLRIAQESDGDIERFDTVIEKYRNTTLASVDPVAASDVRMSLDRMISRSSHDVQRQGIQRHQRAAKENREKAFDTYGVEALRLVRNGDLEGTQENLLKSKAAVDSMVDSGDISRASADLMYLTQQKGVFSQGHKREVMEEAEKDLQSAHKKLDGLASEVPKNFTPKEWESVVDDIRSDLLRIDARAKGSSRSSLKLARQELKKYKESVSLGFDVTPEDRQGVYNMVRGTELEDDFARVHKVQQYSLLPVPDRRAILEAAQSRATTLETQQDFMELKEAEDKLSKMAREDGYSLAVRQGIIEEVPFDPRSPELLAERVTQADELSDYYQTPVSPITDTEARSMADMLPEMTAKEKTDLAMSLQPAPDVWQQIAGKNAGTFAMTGAIGDKDIMEAVFRGQDMLATKQAKKPSVTDYQEIVNDYLGTVGEVYGVEDRRDVINAAIAHNAATSEGEFDSGDFEDSLIAVTGGVAKVNGFKVELPRGVSEDDFEDFVDELQPETIEEIGGLLHYDDYSVVNDAQLVSMGSGRYHLMIGGIAPVDKNNKLFTLEYSDDLRKRNEFHKLRSEYTRANDVRKRQIQKELGRLKLEGIDAVGQ